MTLRVKSINVWTVFKVGTVFHIILHLIVFLAAFFAWYLPSANVAAQFAGKGTVTISEIAIGNEWIRAGFLVIIVGALVSGFVWAILALILSVALGLTGGIELYMGKAPARKPEFYASPSPYTDLAQETKDRRVRRARKSSRFMSIFPSSDEPPVRSVAPQPSKSPPAPTEESPMTIDERRAFNDRLYRIQQYHRMQRRRAEIRDE